MIGEKTIFELRQALLDRRKEILSGRRKMDSSWKELNRPEKELEETASKETLAREIETLDDIGQAQFLEIEDALTKMETTGYGICEECEKSIAVNRLRAIPWTRLCIFCAQEKERNIELRPAPELPRPSIKALSDEEMEAAILEEINADDRIEKEELTVSCEEGVVHLSGLLPSNRGRQILLEIIEDVLGFEDIVDQIRIDRQAWERSDRNPGIVPANEKTEDEVLFEGEDVEDDMTASLQDGTPVEPPSELIPEK